MTEAVAGIQVLRTSPEIIPPAQESSGDDQLRRETVPEVPPAPQCTDATQSKERLDSPAVPSDDTLTELYVRFRDIAVRAQADIQHITERMEIQQKRKLMAETRAITTLYQLNRTIEQLFRQSQSFTNHLLDLQVLKHFIQDLVICVEDVSTTSEDYGVTGGESTLNHSLSVVIKHAEALTKAHEQTKRELKEAKQSLEDQKSLTTQYELMIDQLNAQVASQEAAKVAETGSSTKTESSILRFQKVANLAAGRNNRFTRTLQGLAQSVNSAARMGRQQDGESADLIDSDNTRSVCDGDDSALHDYHNECCAALIGEGDKCSCTSELIKNSLSSGRYVDAWFYLFKLCGTQGRQLRRRSLMYFREFDYRSPSTTRWLMGTMAFLFSLFFLLLAIFTSRG